MLDLRDLLRNPRFRRLWVARLVSNLGNGMAPTAMSFGVLGLPGATAQDLGYVLLAQAVPIVVLLPIGGVIADRLPRALLVAITDLVLSVFVVAQGVLFVTGQATVANVAALNVITGVLSALWWPAFPGIVPAVLGDRDLQRGNALIAVASNAGMISGAGIAGALIAAFGAGPALIIDGLTFLFAGLLVYTFRHITPARPSGESMMDDLSHGWRTFTSFRWLWVIVAAFGVIVGAMRAGFDVGGPVLMKEQFDGARSWAIIQAAQAVGFMSGALLAARIRPARPLVFLMSVSFVIPAYLLALAGPAPFAVLVLCAFGIGVCFDMWGVMWSTAMQTHIPRESLSRASAFDAMGSLILGPVGLGIAGPVIAAFGLRTLFIGAAIVTAIMTLLPLLDAEVRALGWKDREPV